MTNPFSATGHDLDGTTHPAVLTDCDCRDRRRRTGALNFDVQHIAGLVQPKAIGLGCTRVPGSFRDLKVPVPVTERQVIEPGPLSTIQGYRVRGVAGLGQELPN